MVGIVGLGEVLWDVFREGPRFGGAPANFACHARALGAEVAIVSAVGPDSDPLSIPALDLRAVAASILGPSSATRMKPAASLSMSTTSANPAIPSASSQPGTLLNGPMHWPTWRSARGLSVLVPWHNEPPCRGRRFFAFSKNFRPTHSRCSMSTCASTFGMMRCIAQSMQEANILKLNDDELPIVARACHIEMREQNGLEELRVLEALLNQYQLMAVALTRGAEGATLLTRQAVDHCPTPSTVVKDTVGREMLTPPRWSWACRKTGACQSQPTERSE